MIARVKITDVGGLRGSHDFVFVSGKLNIIEGSNAGGKSSVIQALAAIQSVPADCDISPALIDEAVRLGVKTNPRNLQEGFVHILAKRARVELDLDGKRSEYVVDARGRSETCPDGDPRFLVAGILSNRCRVIRQLRGQDTIEPDDFTWAVSELSLAKRYEAVRELLEKGRDEAKALHEVAKRKLKEYEQLQSEIKRLERQMKPVEAELDKLREKYNDANQTSERIAELSRKRDSVRNTIARLSAQISVKKRELEQHEQEKARIKKQIEEIQAEIQDIDISALESDLNRDSEAVEAEVRRLIAERDSIDGILNLFVAAERTMEQQGSMCPLCNRGTLTQEEVERRLAELRQKKEDITSRVSQMRLGLQQRKHELAVKKDHLRKLEEQMDELSVDLKQLDRGDDVSVSSWEKDLEAKKAELERLEQEIEQLSALKNEEIRTAFREKDAQYKQLFEQLAVARQHLYECTMLVRQQSLSPDKALDVTQKWMDFYDALIVHTRNMAEAQKVRASELFNNEIKELLDKLDFREFRTVMLNREYRLYIERFDEKKKDYVSQQVRTLSTSEQMSIALILQMALKETYMPETPFFLVDEVMEDFDEARRRVVLDYLMREARKKDMIIVATSLAKEQQRLNVRYEEA